MPPRERGEGQKEGGGEVEPKGTTPLATSGDLLQTALPSQHHENKPHRIGTLASEDIRPYRNCSSVVLSRRSCLDISLNTRGCGVDWAEPRKGGRDCTRRGPRHCRRFEASHLLGLACRAHWTHGCRSGNWNYEYSSNRIGCPIPRRPDRRVSSRRSRP